MPRVQLFQGEKDGYTLPIDTVQNRPDVFYVVSLADEELVSEAKTTKGKADLRAKLSKLAYKFQKAVYLGGKIGWEYRYERDPEQDKVEADPQ